MKTSPGLFILRPVGRLKNCSRDILLAPQRARVCAGRASQGEWTRPGIRVNCPPSNKFSVTWSGQYTVIIVFVAMELSHWPILGFHWGPTYLSPPVLLLIPSRGWQAESVNLESHLNKLGPSFCVFRGANNKANCRRGIKPLLFPFEGRRMAADRWPSKVLLLLVSQLILICIRM